MTKRILLVEDEADIQELMSMQLRRLGFDVVTVDSGEKALVLLKSEAMTFDLAILDWMLPAVSGLEICRFLRLYRHTRHMSVLMVTALTGPEHVIAGLDAGADDYLGKPFEPEIFEARVRALLRRSERQPQISSEIPIGGKLLRLGDITLDVDACKVRDLNGELALTLSEFKLLQAMLENPGKVLTRRQLMEIVQGGEVHVTARTIDTHIFGLRKKIGESAKLIETIRGIGYRVIIEYDKV